MSVTRHLMLASAVATLCIFPVASAAIVVQYRFGVDYGAASYSPTIEHPLVTDDYAADDVTWGIGTTGSKGISTGGGLGGNPRPGLYTRSTGVADTLANAVAGNDYVAFTIAANTGYKLYLTGFSFDYNFNDTPGATFTLRSGLDGYTGNLAQFTTSVTGSYQNTGVIGLGSGFGGLSTVGFRIFLNDGSFESDLYTLRLDNITVNGDVIPEPASAALFGLAGLALLRRWRRAGQR